MCIYTKLMCMYTWITYLLLLKASVHNIALQYSGKVWQGEVLVNLLFLSIWQNKVWWSNTLTNRIVIVWHSSDVTCHSLASNSLTFLSNLLTLIRIELLVMCALLSARNSHKIIRWSLDVFFDMVTHVSLQYHVTDHHNVHRLVLSLVSRSWNLCHRTLIH